MVRYGQVFGQLIWKKVMKCSLIMNLKPYLDVKADFVLYAQIEMILRQKVISSINTNNIHTTKFWKLSKHW
jgi:hypothetical protein